MTVEAGSVVDVLAEGRQLLDEARAKGRGQGIKVVVRQPGQKVILLGLPSGGGLPEHEAPGAASLVCLSGEVVLSSGGESWSLQAGTAHVIPQAVHELQATVDSICLLTVCAD
ncbi:MAG: hypothetical protein ABIP45_07945 [Knoellia sp.]